MAHLTDTDYLYEQGPRRPLRLVGLHGVAYVEPGSVTAVWEDEVGPGIRHAGTRLLWVAVLPVSSPVPVLDTDENRQVLRRASRFTEL